LHANQARGSAAGEETLDSTARRCALVASVVVVAKVEALVAQYV
jgi:hypothetical protein